MIAGGDRPDRCRIQYLVIPTADRPAILDRCLGSYVRHLDHHGRRLPILVFDDSRVPANQDQTRAVVEAVQRASAFDVRYVGDDECRVVQTGMVARGLEPAAAEWLIGSIGPRGAGRVRNRILLFCAGSAFLTVDDDTVCTTWRTGIETGAAIAGHIDLRVTRVFERREDALAAIAPAAGDLVDAHESLLGSRLDRLVGEPDTDAAGAMCDHLRGFLDTAAARTRVRATWAGIAGDGAAFCPYPILFSRGATRDALAADVTLLERALSSREVARAVQRPTITHEPWLMTYCAGVDGGSLLPPFSPIGTNEDGLFGAMLQLCEPHALIGQIPMGIVHDSARIDSYRAGVMPSASSVRLTDIARWIAGGARTGPVTDDASTRLTRLGDAFMQVSTMHPDAFWAQLLQLGFHAKRQLLRACHAVLADRYAYPPPWISHMRAYQAAVLGSLESPRALVPVEMAPGLGLSAAVEQLQHYFRMFGSALQAWPEAWDACRAEGLVANRSMTPRG